MSAYNSNDSDSSDDYFKDYILEDRNTCYKINAKYYQEVSNTH